jgi:hypothetical protein
VRTPGPRRQLREGHQQQDRSAPGPRLGLRHGRRPSRLPAPPGEWNYQRVTVTGSRIEVELNGTRILDADLAEVKEYMGNSPHPGKDRAKGYFGLAGHADPVEYRQIEVRRLD